MTTLKQAIAIGLSEARKAGAKVPPERPSASRGKVEKKRPARKAAKTK